MSNNSTSGEDIAPVPSRLVSFEKKYIPNDGTVPYKYSPLGLSSELDADTRVILGQALKPSSTRIFLDSLKNSDELTSIEFLKAEREAYSEWDRFVLSRLIGLYSVTNCSDQSRAVFGRDADFIATTRKILEGSPYLASSGRFIKKPLEPSISMYGYMLENNSELGANLVKAKALAEAHLLHSSGLLIRVIGSTALDSGVRLPAGQMEQLANLMGEQKKVDVYKDKKMPYDLKNVQSYVRATKKIVRAIDKLPNIVMGDVLKEELETAKSAFNEDVVARTEPTEHQLFIDTKNTIIIVPFGSDAEEYYIDKLGLNPQQQTDISNQIIPLDGVDYTAIRKQKKEEVRAAEENRLIQAREHDAPILEELTRIAEEHNALFSEYEINDGREARIKKILGGNDSLVNALYILEFVDGADRKELAAYASAIHTVVEAAKALSSVNAYTTHDEFEGLLCTSEELRDTFNEYLLQNKLISGAMPPSLHPELREYVDFIKNNWEQIIKAIEISGYACTVEQLDAVKIMLSIPQEEIVIEQNVQYDENPDDEIYSNDTEVDAEIAKTIEEEIVDTTLHEVAKETEDIVATDIVNYRAYVDLHADQLSVEIFPAGTTLANLRHDLEGVLKSTKRDVDLGQIENERMQTLLDLYDIYGGQLLRSSDKGQALLKDLYYVLVFEYENDVYAIAENPLYSNATYLARKGLTPLLGDESIITLLMNNRKDARTLGAKQLIHAPQEKTGKSHLERTVEALDQIATHKALV